MTPYQEANENYGGGKSSLPVFEVEEKAIKLLREMIAEDDLTAAQISRIRKVIQLLGSSV